MILITIIVSSKQRQNRLNIHRNHNDDANIDEPTWSCESWQSTRGRRGWHATICLTQFAQKLQPDSSCRAIILTCDDATTPSPIKWILEAAIWEQSACWGHLPHKPTSTSDKRSYRPITSICHKVKPTISLPDQEKTRENCAKLQQQPKKFQCE